jgi:SsrA-binding protein
MTSKRKGEPKGVPEGVKVVVQNRRARFDFAIEDRYEAGIALSGSEVKSLRAGNVGLSDAYAQPRGDELFLVNCRIGEYQPAAFFGHSPLRDRKLLLNREEIDRIRSKVEQRGYTLVPLSLYFKAGWAKVELGLARGRTHEDRRDAIAERESKREMDRAMSRRKR